MIAGVGRATGYAVMFRYPITFVAVDAVWIQKLPQPLKAGGIVGELGFKVADRVPNRFAFNVIPELLVCHKFRLAWQVPTVKG